MNFKLTIKGAQDIGRSRGKRPIAWEEKVKVYFGNKGPQVQAES